MMLFDNLSNNFNSTNKVGFVEVLYFNANTISIKQYVDLESIRVQKVGEYRRLDFGCSLTCRPVVI